MAEDHPIFHRVRQLAHSDLHVLRRSVNEKTGKLRSEIIVDDVRAAINFLHLTPAESAWRVLVVDCADELNRNAANALLKILEEPRPRSVLILVCHAPGRLLPTIRSRCRKLAVTPLATPILREAISRMRPDLDPSDLALAAELAEGSIGRALDLAGENGGLELFRGIGALMASWPRLDTNLLHKLSDRFGGKAGEQRFATAVEQMDWWLRRFARRAVLGQGGQTDLFPAEGATMDRLLEAASLDRWLQAWEKSNAVFARVASANLDRKQAWLTGWLALGTAGRDETTGPAT
jgi:DNA polymerase III subunit delta'